MGREDPPVENALTNGARGWWTSQARFASTKLVDIVFDLKSDYEIMRVKLAKGAKAWAEGFAVLTCRDGKSFAEQAATSSKDGWQANWLSCELPNARARYVRVQVRVPGSGYIDEIEIWGRRVQKPH